VAAGGFDAEIQPIQELAVSSKLAFDQAEDAEQRLAKHKELAQEVKDVKAQIKATEMRKQELADAARIKISEKEAKAAILGRLHCRLLETYRQYLRADQRACRAAVENLWDKYAVTAITIEDRRKSAATILQTVLQDLNYV
jgi:type I restriction enzyme M protein